MSREQKSVSSSPPLPFSPSSLPPFWGARHLASIPLAELWPLLDRRALFRVGWGARGLQGPAWESLRAEFEARLAAMQASAGDYLHPAGVYGYFPTQAEGDELLVAGGGTTWRFAFPRQPRGERRCLADYFAPVSSGCPDLVAFQVVTVGAGATERYAALEAAGEYSAAYFTHGLAAQVTEAAAEWLHARIRRELGLPPGQGKRYAWGYPACPDLGGHFVLFNLLAQSLGVDPAGFQALTGLSLTAAGQLLPEHSTAALVVFHPAARYFGVK